jgi:hypothetical protein
VESIHEGIGRCYGGERRTTLSESSGKAETSSGEASPK